MSRICPSCGAGYKTPQVACSQDGAILIEKQLQDDFDNRLGKKLGGYVLAARVADGAMGRVYEGRHPNTHECVAIKVLHRHMAVDTVAVERFRREYESAEELDHPYVVKVLHFGHTGDESWFMVMEFLHGLELSKSIHGPQPMPMARIVRVLSQVALAVDYAHSFGFVHRDLKPDNIYLCDSQDGPVARVLDFGSVKLQIETGSKLTAIGTTVGSPYYMSPEQATGAGDVDWRTDVFAVAAMLYEMLTNRVAFAAPNVALILMKIMNEHPPPPSSLSSACPPAVDDVIDKGLFKDKKERYGSVGDLANALIDALGLEGNAQHWADKPETQIEEALAAAAPATPGSWRASLRAAVHGGLRTPLPPVPLNRGHTAVMLSLTIGLVVVGGVLLYLIG